MKYPIILIMSCLFLISCRSHTEETIHTNSEVLDNGEYIEIEKTNRETTNIGMLTGRNYGVSHSFRYKIITETNQIEWKGVSGQEPKNIIFAQDTVYVRYLQTQSKQIETIDSLNQDTTYNYEYEVKEFSRKSIDKRYFFKLFGSQSWRLIPIKEYNIIKQKYKEYAIPNDEELKIGIVD